MKFKITTSSGCNYDPNDNEVEFTTLEEFIDWCLTKKHEIIIDVHKHNIPQLEIYDDYREI